jgi:hypothetical protein
LPLLQAHTAVNQISISMIHANWQTQL